MSTLLYRIDDVPPPDAYASAFLSLRVADDQRRILLAHCSADGMTASAPELAAAAGLLRHSQVNLRYGRLGHAVADFLGIRTDVYGKGPLWTTALAEGWTARENGRWYWRLYSSVAEAVRRTGWRSLE
jgi:hypothetical protein